MPLAGKGMLLTSMDIAPADEAEFNRWGTTASISKSASRFAGFLEARRYVAHDGKPEISQPLFHRNLRGARQPGLSHRAGQPDRLVEGQYRALQEHDPRGRAHHHQPRAGPWRRARHRPAPPAAGGKDNIARRRCGINSIPQKLDGIISMHLLESDPVLSKPITDDPSAANPGAGDWFVLDRRHGRGCDRDSRRRRASPTTPRSNPPMISTGVYRLMWDLAKSEILRRAEAHCALRCTCLHRGYNARS